MAEKKNILLHKRSVQQGVQPSGTTLDYGEIAVNYNVNDPFLSIRTTAIGKTDQTYAKFIDESAINDKLSKKSDTSHTHSAYVNQNAFSNVIADSTTIGADTTTDTLTIAKSGAITITGDATNNKITIGISTGTTSSTVAKGNHNHDKVYLKTGATATAAAKVTNALTFGGKTYDGSEAKEITAADLGLSGAMRYIGMVEGLSDGDPSDIITINGVDITPEPGNVVIDTDLHKEYIWNGDCWEELGSEGNYKVKQNAVTINNSKPTTYTTTSFIYTLSQDENGVISGKNGKIPFAKQNEEGIVKLCNGDITNYSYNDGEAAAAEHNHNGAYVKKQEFEDNELVVSQALNDLNEAISGVETSISDCVTAPVVDGIPTTTMEDSWFIKTPGFVIGNENSLADNSGFVVADTGDGHLMTVHSVMFERWLLSFGDTTEYIYYDSNDDKLKKHWGNGDRYMNQSFATEDWVEDQVRMEYVTYSQLKELRDNSQLVPGRQYRITDYVTTTTQANTQSAGHQFDVIVTADDNNTLNEIARAIHHQGDTYFSNSDLNAWQIWYCLDNDKGRFPWAFGNVGKTITVSDTDMTVIGEYVGTYTYEGTTYHRWDALIDGTLASFLTVSDSPNVGDTISVFAIISYGIFEALPLPITEVKEGSNDEGYGVIYRMIDEHNNDLPYDFKNIQFVRKLTYGDLDLDNGTDEFVFTFDDIDENSGTHYDSSLGKVCYGNIIKKSDNGLNNIVFLNGFQADYDECIGNIFGNNCYNITFGYNAISNTFGDYCYENIFEDECINNIFGDECHDNTFGDECHDNTFGNNCYENTFRENCNNNTFGNGCYRNTLCYNCNNNTFGNSCSDNFFGNYCAYNIFGTAFINNDFKDSCAYNTFGNSCGNNEFGMYSRYNAVGNYCHNIHIGDSCDGNTFGNDCKRIYFGSENALISYCQHIIFDNGNEHIRFESINSTSSTNKLQNIHVSAGVSGEDSIHPTRINIDTVGQNYTIEVAKNSAGVVKTFCMADLIA